MPSSRFRAKYITSTSKPEHVAACDAAEATVLTVAPGLGTPNTFGIFESGMGNPPAAYIDGAVLYGMDGLNLDVEYDGSMRSEAWYQEHARLLTLFTCELRAMIHSLSYVPDR